MAVCADDGGLQVVDIERADLERTALLCQARASALRAPDALHAPVPGRQWSRDNDLRALPI